MEQEERLCDKVETVRQFTYLDDRVSAGGGCEAAVMARTMCKLVTLRECANMLYGRSSLKLKGAAYRSHIRPANYAWK